MSVDIHHLAVVCSDLQRSISFYHTVLGLHFIAKNPDLERLKVGHFYWAPVPGSYMTFYHCPGLREHHAGSVTPESISFSVSSEAVTFWEQRLKRCGVGFRVFIDEPEDRIAFCFEDPDGLRLRLLFIHAGSKVAGASEYLPADYRIKGIHGVEITGVPSTGLRTFFTRHLNMDWSQRTASLQRFTCTGKTGSVIDVNTGPTAGRAGGGYGRIHHIAFGVHNWAHFVRLHKAFRCQQERTLFKRHPNRFAALYVWQSGGLLFELVGRRPPWDSRPFLQAAYPLRDWESNPDV